MIIAQNDSANAALSARLLLILSELVFLADLQPKQ